MRQGFFKWAALGLAVMFCFSGCAREESKKNGTQSEGSSKEDRGSSDDDSNYSSSNSERPKATQYDSPSLRIGKKSAAQKAIYGG